MAEEIESSKCQIRTLEALAMDEELARIHMPADTTAASDNRNRLLYPFDGFWRQCYLVDSQFGRHSIFALNRCSSEYDLTHPRRFDR